MKYLLGTLVIAAVAVIDPIKAGKPLNNNYGLNGPLQEVHKRKLNNVTVWLGEDAKMTSSTSERGRIQRFYRDVLGCTVTKRSETQDIIHLGTNYYIGVSYENVALSEPDQLKAIWLELRTDHPELLKDKILKFGIKKLEFRDKTHFYFQAPGGQVFRLVGTTEDMSKWQR